MQFTLAIVNYQPLQFPRKFASVVLDLLGKLRNKVFTVTLKKKKKRIIRFV